MTKSEVDEYIISKGFYGHADGLCEPTDAVFFCNLSSGVALDGENLSHTTSRYKGYSSCGDELLDYSLKGLDSIKTIN